MVKTRTNRIVNKSKTKSSASSKTRSVKSRAKRSKIVPYYPNRMTFAVSALAGTLLVLLALIAVIGSGI